MCVCVCVHYELIHFVYHLITAFIFIACFCTIYPLSILNECSRHMPYSSLREGRRKEDADTVAILNKSNSTNWTNSAAIFEIFG